MLKPAVKQEQVRFQSAFAGHLQGFLSPVGHRDRAVPAKARQEDGFLTRLSPINRRLTAGPGADERSLGRFFRGRIAARHHQRPVSPGRQAVREVCGQRRLARAAGRKAANADHRDAGHAFTAATGVEAAIA